MALMAILQKIPVRSTAELAYLVLYRRLVLHLYHLSQFNNLKISILEFNLRDVIGINIVDYLFTAILILHLKHLLFQCRVKAA